MKNRFGIVSFERLLGVILIALSIASVVFIAIQTARLRDVTECQAGYNEAYGKAIQARANAAREERQAQRRLWTTVLNQQIPVEEKRKAFETYLKALDEADRVREAAALPNRKC
jgi:predicted solute-binding protein